MPMDQVANSQASWFNKLVKLVITSVQVLFISLDGTRTRAVSPSFNHYHFTMAINIIMGEYQTAIMPVIGRPTVMISVET